MGRIQIGSCASLARMMVRKSRLEEGLHHLQDIAYLSTRNDKAMTEQIAISASVGEGGDNRPEDVRLVQAALNRVPPANGGPASAMTVDGSSGPKTVEAIRRFQTHHGLPTDGRIDPGGSTLRKLNELAGMPPTPGALEIVFASSARQDVVSAHTIAVLTAILTAAGLTKATITSTQRTAEDQARAMFANIRQKGVASQKELYGDNGDQVIDAYVAANDAGKSDDEIKAAMLAKINELGPGNVSKHAADPAKLNVIDVAPSSIANRAAFEAAVRADKRVSRFLTPQDGDPAYHLEVPQPGAN